MVMLGDLAMWWTGGKVTAISENRLHGGGGSTQSTTTKVTYPNFHKMISFAQHIHFSDYYKNTDCRTLNITS